MKVIKVNIINQPMRKKKVISFMNILKHQLNLIGKKILHYHHIQAIKVLIKVDIYLFIISILLPFSSAEQQTEGPSVDPNALTNDGSSKSLDPKKSTIGQRRAPQAKKVDIHYLF
jgi:hypothetical protein